LFFVIASRRRHTILVSDWSSDVCSSDLLPQLLEIVNVARGARTEEIRTAKAFYAVSEKLGTARLREALRAAAGNDPWERRYAGRSEERRVGEGGGCGCAGEP